LYPTDVTVDYEIAKELGIDRKANLNNEEDFLKLISEIFTPDKLRKVIGSIIQFSRLKEK